MAFVEKTAKSVDEAVAAALVELNISKEDAIIEVLQEAKSGFLFGWGSKDAIVRVTAKEIVEAPKSKLESSVDNLVDSISEVKEAAVETVAKKSEEIKAAVEAKKEEIVEAKAELDKKVEAVSEKISAKKEELSEKAAAKKEEFSRKRDEFRKKASEGREEFGRKRDELRKKAAQAKDDAIDAAVNALEGAKSREPRKYVISDESVNTAREFLQKVFTAMKIDVVMEKFINKNDGTVTFKLHGEDMGILIGKHGQTLDSLQYLTNLVANKNSNERVRVIIDVEDYRDRRIDTLTHLAYRLADKVKRSGERVALEPMNPHERKIIHMALQSDRRVTTLSEGDEPYRHVVIELKK